MSREGFAARHISVAHLVWVTQRFQRCDQGRRFGMRFSA